MEESLFNCFTFFELYGSILKHFCQEKRKITNRTPCVEMSTQGVRSQALHTDNDGENTKQNHSHKGHCG